jgi:hypothetical protein
MFCKTINGVVDFAVDGLEKGMVLWEVIPYSIPMKPV